MNLASIRLSFFNVLFVLVLLAFLMNGSTIVNFFFDKEWSAVLLLISFFYLLLNNRLLKSFSPALLFWLFVYLFWCVLTSFWSISFSDTLIKSSLLAVIAITFSSGGSEWVRRYGWRNSLNWSFLILIVSLFSGLWGKSTATYSIASGAVLYTGATGSANLFGFFCAITFPFLIWQCRKKNIFCLCLAALNLYYLILSSSRSAFLLMLIVFVFFVFSLNLKRKWLVFLVSGLILCIGILTAASVLENYLYKSVRHTNILETRKDPWAMSYHGALLGGMVGVGYAKSSLEVKVTNQWLGSTGNREKGNSQLASVEETGWIGLALHLVFLIFFLKPAIQFWRKLSGEKKIFFSLPLGAVVGVLIESIFESWWSGPLSQENIYFWTMFGVVRGLMCYMPRNAA